MADSIDERLNYIEDRLKDMFISGAEAQKLIEEKKRLETWMKDTLKPFSPSMNA